VQEQYGRTFASIVVAKYSGRCGKFAEVGLDGGGDGSV
jgi:hypothetical protein